MRTNHRKTYQYTIFSSPRNFNDLQHRKYHFMVFIDSMVFNFEYACALTEYIGTDRFMLSGGL